MILWSLHIIILGALAYLLIRFVKEELKIVVFFSALGIRLVTGIIAGLMFYSLYPGTDSVSFYETSMTVIDNFSVWSIWSGDFDPGNYARQPRVIFFIQILSTLLFLSGGSYWIATLYFSFLSFVASIYFVIQFNRLFPELKPLAISCFLFLPSVLFWSSGILKDTVSFSAFIILIAQILKLYKGVRLNFLEMLIGILSLLILFKIKHYLLITALLFTGIILAIVWFKKLSGTIKWIAPIISILAFFLMTQFVHPYLTINRIPQTIYDNNTTITNNTSEEKKLGIVLENPDWVSVVKASPEALSTGLFRPNLFDKTPIWGLWHKIENFTLLSLVFLSLLIAIKNKPSVNWWLIVPSLLCILMLATLLAMTTPNLGTLVRYKNAFMPFFFLICSIWPYKYLTSKTS